MSRTGEYLARMIQGIAEIARIFVNKSRPTVTVTSSLQSDLIRILTIGQKKASITSKEGQPGQVDALMHENNCSLKEMPTSSLRRVMKRYISKFRSRRGT